MNDLDIFMEAVGRLLSAYGIYMLLTAFASVVILSLVFKPILKKALTARRNKALLLIEDAREMYGFEISKNESELSPVETSVVRAKIIAYERQIAEYEEVIGDKWFADKMSHVCFAFLVVLCFVGTGIQFALTVGLSSLLSASFFISSAATVCAAEMAYSVYEEIGLKKLYKLICEKLKIK